MRDNRGGDQKVAELTVDELRALVATTVRDELEAYRGRVRLEQARARLQRAHGLASSPEAGKVRDAIAELEAIIKLVAGETGPEAGVAASARGSVGAPHACPAAA